MTEEHVAPENLNFEDALRELEIIVRKLEEGRVPLEEAVIAYERGDALKRRCDELLKNARMKIQEIMKDKDGSVSLKESDLQSME